MTVSTRIAVMREGRIAQLGEPREVYEAPQTRYVAEFIGDVNVLEGAAEAGAATLALTCGGRASLPGPAAGGAMAVAIRPEKVSIARAPQGETVAAAARDDRLAGVVEDIAYLGDISVFHVRLADGARVKATRTNRRRAGADEITWDDPVELAWDPSAVVPLAD
ncbi:MAG: TOBE domain-containing protein [Pseudomonadota bacterium]